MAAALARNGLCRGQRPIGENTFHISTGFHFSEKENVGRGRCDGDNNWKLEEEERQKGKKIIINIYITGRQNVKHSDH